MKNILLVLSILFVCQFTHAQDAYTIYKMESIYLEGSKYIKNDVKYPIGIFASNLAQEMEVSPHAAAEWKKYKTFRNWGLVTSLVGLGLSIGALRVEDNNELRAGLAISGLGLALVSIPLSIKASNQIQKSIWTRNRDILIF